VRKLHDWKAVKNYYDGGHTAQQCRERFQITYAAWAMAIRRGKLIIKSHLADGPRRHDWKIVQAYYNEGYSVRGCIRRFGFSLGAWQKAVRRGEVTARPLGRALKDLLANGKARTNIKHRLMRAGLLENRCSQCGLREWCGEPLVVQIDHINGIREDYRLENLRMLCPNCHSQTQNYGRRNASPRLLHESQAPL
jgi:Zn finger protein HypA/HybF involved in hydrogenase expression